MDRVAKLASERTVVVFTASNCSMGDVVTSLLSSLGVNAAVHELDRDPRGPEMERSLPIGSALAPAPAAAEHPLCRRVRGRRPRRRDQQGHGPAPRRRARAHAQERQRALAIGRIEQT
ncbi:unnamed protein product [Miscanthus lutarioriparius]|uniref:Glutaredoxin domain-containing protein n=1 Tax=Miscanthus lutarioriparius TaxID=422564 RepID=A0A811Q7I0_9POAL|nr:unnamed protein product [Miscanthus lutarioriparius]